MKFDWKKFLVTGVVGAFAFGFLSGVVPEIFVIWETFTLGAVAAFGIAFWIAEYVYQNWG